MESRAPKNQIDGISLDEPREGELLQPRAFTSPEVFDAELREIFERSWVHVADLPELSRAGDYVTAQLGRVPVIVLRADDGELRGFVNACRHRGATLAEGQGNCGHALRCPYHAWSYDTTGRLAGVPFREEFCDLGGRDLLPIRVASAGPMVFACADERAPSFADWAGQLPEAMAGSENMEAAFSFSYDVAANWKVSVENALDGYHIRFVHDFLNDFLAQDLGTGFNVLEPHSSYTIAPMSEEASTAIGRENCFVRFGLVFPNIIPVLTPFDFSYLRIDPIAPEKLRITARSFDVEGPGRYSRELRQAAFDRTNKQDIAVVERVQRGLRAPGLPAGIHSQRLEQRIGHFEALWRSHLRDRELIQLRRAG
jgi:phenylpropionate dioxygenase-like ring-hydroxylating dioxygenase large terminal subunit